MRSLNFALLPVAALTIGLALAGCSSFDPTDLADWISPKKPLPGERRAVFPEGVPGVPQGVPPELTKGYQESQAAEANVAAAPVVIRPEPAKPKPKPKPKTASAPPRPATQAPAQDSIGPAPPAQKQAKPAPGPDTSRAQQSQPQMVWPEPVPSGTSSR